MKEPFGGIILNVAFRMLIPFTIVYGVYVLCLGEFSPGGGFQAGALLAVGVLLARLILGFDTKFNVLGKTSVVLAGGIFLIEIGVAICVMMTIINLLDAIVKRGEDDGSVK